MGQEKERQEEEQRECLEGTIIQTAACPFCGQVRMREGAAMRISDEEMEEYAKLHCDCVEAQTYQRRSLRLKKAKDQILSWYNQEETEFTKKAVEIVQMVQGFQMDSAVLVDVDGKKLKIGMSSKGLLKITISQTTSAKREIP